VSDFRKQGVFFGAPEDYELHEMARMAKILEQHGQAQGALTYRDDSTYDINEFQMEGEQVLIAQALIDAMSEFDRGKVPFFQTERSRREPDRLSNLGVGVGQPSMNLAPSGTPKRRF
jgi:hypothetical protein